jgi:hypothetical protein
VGEGEIEKINMKMRIAIKEKKVRLSLLRENQELDFREILEEKSLSEKLLLEIDSLLGKNNFSREDVPRIEVESDQNDNFTTTRMAKSVANAWNWKF